MVSSEMIVVPAVFLIPSAVIVFRMWIKHREKMATVGRPAEQSREIEARLARMEDAVNAIAIEMERVGEGQRFLTKLFAERGQGALPEGQQRPGGRAVTPH